MSGPGPVPPRAAAPGRVPWRRRRLPTAAGALVPVVFYSLLSLSGPLAEGHGLLAAALAARLALGVAVVVLVWGRRRASHLLAVGYLVLVLATGLLDHAYDAVLVLVTGLALVVTLVHVVVDAVWRP